ncbi:hypothetical protein [Agromyces flavus]|uniref:Uncharacterized protein n=1 Tax=Agromyces flavus TaxID=589382 RepID=A0A1H2A727_9MICO|nr:hypothetical protein [Agromyces flavus]SDT41266.1 hypothetical protein SAMN04489721_3526 [Agromyces flavus]
MPRALLPLYNSQFEQAAYDLDAEFGAEGDPAAVEGRSPREVVASEPAATDAPLA